MKVTNKEVLASEELGIHGDSVDFETTSVAYSNNTATHGHTRTYTNAEKRCNEISVDRLDRLYLYSPQAEQPNDGAQRRVGKGSKNLNFRANGVPLFFLNKKFDKTYQG